MNHFANLDLAIILNSVVNFELYCEKILVKSILLVQELAYYMQQFYFERF